MYNDQIMLLYLVLSIYHFAKDRPYIGTFFFSMAYGLKAGALLIIPAMLSVIHYNYGTIKLIVCVAFMVGFQVLIALPFLLGETTVADYLHRSKLTGAGRNGVQGSAAFWDYLAAHQELSIFWTFLDNESYFNKDILSKRVKMAIPLVNVWFSFVQ